MYKCFEQFTEIYVIHSSRVFEFDNNEAGKKKNWCSFNREWHKKKIAVSAMESAVSPDRTKQFGETTARTKDN